MTTLVLAGGFLGAGKTTLLIAASRLLRGRGVRTAMILNDQGGELVDTALASTAGFEADEVTGACFCCRFSDFVRRAEGLLKHEPQVIFAEPVGSCMDISATILQPLKKFYGKSGKRCTGLLCDLGADAASSENPFEGFVAAK